MNVDWITFQLTHGRTLRGARERGLKHKKYVCEHTQEGGRAACCWRKSEKEMRTHQTSNYITWNSPEQINHLKDSWLKLLIFQLYTIYNVQQYISRSQHFCWLFHWSMSHSLAFVESSDDLATIGRFDNCMWQVKGRFQTIVRVRFSTKCNVDYENASLLRDFPEISFGEPLVELEKEIKSWNQLSAAVIVYCLINEAALLISKSKVCFRFHANRIILVSRVWWLATGDKCVKCEWSRIKCKRI